MDACPAAGVFFPAMQLPSAALEPGKAEKSGYRTPRGTERVGPASIEVLTVSGMKIPHPKTPLSLRLSRANEEAG